MSDDLFGDIDWTKGLTDGPFGGSFTNAPSPQPSMSADDILHAMAKMKVIVDDIVPDEKVFIMNTKSFNWFKAQAKVRDPFVFPKLATPITERDFQLAMDEAWKRLMYPSPARRMVNTGIIKTSITDYIRDSLWYYERDRKRAVPFRESRWLQTLVVAIAALWLLFIWSVL